jgi:hypothetical protein
MLFSLMMMIVFPLIGVCGDTLGLGRGFIIVGVGTLMAGGAAFIMLKKRSSALGDHPQFPRQRRKGR